MQVARLLFVVLVTAVVLSFGNANAATSEIELGIDRSNLTQQSKAIMQKTLQDIHNDKAVWFRDVLRNATPHAIAAFVNELELAKQNQLKFLANIMLGPDDFDDDYIKPNSGASFGKRCGWPQGSYEISKLNPQKLSERLERQLDAVKQAGLTIDAFEIGNEIDWICFNGDVPDGRAPSGQEFLTAVRGYALFLKTAATVIKNPKYFPQAKLISAGLAHASDQWDHPVHHFAQPGRMIAALRNLDGFNYLDNNLYHIDGYGTHLYASPNDVIGSVTRKLEEDARLIGRDKPFWPTEWGTGNASGYPNQAGQTRSQVIADLLANFKTLNRQIPLGPIFFYSYDNALVDANGNPTSISDVLSKYH